MAPSQKSFRNTLLRALSDADRQRLGALLFAFGIVLASTSPIAAQTLFDGSWTVTIRGHGGECLEATSISLTVKDGRITVAGPQGAGRAGSVSHAGSVRLRVRDVSAAGALSGGSGSGKWFSAACNGTWIAHRV